MWEKGDCNLFASTRYRATGKMTTKTFLSLKRSKTCRTVYCGFKINQDVFKGKVANVFHCFCRFTFVSINCDIGNFVLLFLE